MDGCRIGHMVKAIYQLVAHALDTSDRVLVVVGGTAAYLHRNMEGAASIGELVWQVPLGAIVAFIIWRLLSAPFLALDAAKRLKDIRTPITREELRQTQLEVGEIQDRLRALPTANAVASLRDTVNLLEQRVLEGIRLIPTILSRDFGLRDSKGGTLWDIESVPHDSAYQSLILSCVIQFDVNPRMVVESVALRIMDLTLVALDWTSSQMVTQQTYDVEFEIPEMVTPGGHEVELDVFAKGQHWYSEKLLVTFPMRR